MIRTHRPRGFAWACPSAFQQTPQVREISYEESEASYTQDDILCDDAREYTLAERAAKRRRVEAIADDFLNGYLPQIHSARATKASTEDAISALFTLPKVGRQEFEIAKESVDAFKDGDIWDDVEDDGEVLRRFIASQQPQTNDQAQVILHAFETMQEEVVTEVQAQASCGPKRRLRPATISRDPSEDALRKAAELRNRRSKKVVSLQIESQPQSCPRPVIAESQTQPSFESTTDETASDCGPSPTPAWTSSKWLRTGAFMPRRKAVTEDCSRDELGASSFFSPSQRTRLASRSRSAQSSFQSAQVPAGSTIPATSFQSVPPQGQSSMDDRSPERTSPAEHESANTFSASVYETAPNDNMASASDQTQNDSQVELLKRQGIKAAPRKSWATVNQESEQPNSVTIGETAPTEHTPVSASIRNTLQQSVASDAEIATKVRKAKSAGTTPVDVTRKTSNRRRTAPSESQNLADEMAKLPADQRRRIGAFRTQYSAVQANGTSPFMFRRKASEFNKTDDPDIEPIPVESKVASKTSRRRIQFPSSDAPQMTKHDLAGAVTVVEAETTVVQPETPLVSEHLNSILPKATSTKRRSSSLRKSLREELLASGAEMSRCPGDSSSQPEAHDIAQDEPTVVEDSFQDDIENHDTTAQVQAESQPKQPWVGTQQLLAQAHQDLFTSPDKTESALYLGDKTTPQAQGGRVPRRPLQILSQERMPMPSTQALLEDWPGWSSIKKRRSDGKRPSLGYSPSLTKAGLPIIASDPVQSYKRNERRRSSLRHSLSFNDSPAPMTTTKVPPIHSFATTIANTADDSFLKPAVPPRKSSGKVASSLSFGMSSIDLPGQSEFADENEEEIPDPFGSHEPMTSYPNAQRASMDSQDIEVTLTELMGDVLGSAKKDMGSLGLSGFSSF